MKHHLLAPIHILTETTDDDMPLTQNVNDVCGYCHKPISDSYSLALAPPYADYKHQDVYLPKYHSKCSDVVTTLENIRGLEASLRFGWAKKTRKTGTAMIMLKERFYNQYQEWQKWYEETYNECLGTSQ